MKKNLFKSVFELHPFKFATKARNPFDELNIPIRSWILLELLDNLYIYRVAKTSQLVFYRFLMLFFICYPNLIYSEVHILTKPSMPSL